ncbi:NAD(P)H-binding protein [Streptomyces sp.]|uniref:NAD(P)H-binding protein n=1 Tax=Streptomyces sp. TaxID=1931 RepID=UPI002D7733D9|nr:NAD(P)H-binding protein [Streptomyces sp.]HET6358303.1 NAD(P)H-binding protein [Streptomyces sp.]
MILVTGATGHVGRHVVSGLLEAGEKVRALSRNPGSRPWPPGVEVLPGDLTQPGTLAAALGGVDSMYLFPVFGAVPDAVEAARQAGVKHVVMLSSQAIEYSTGDPHLACEEAVTASGLSWTFVRTGALMVNDLHWAGQFAGEGVVRGAYESSPLAPIDERDIAAVVVRSLLTPRSGTVHTVTGPQSLTQVDRVRIAGQVLGRTVPFEELPREHVRKQMTAHLPAALVDELLDHRASLVGTTAEVLPTVEQVTGRAPYTYAEWLAHHEADFRPAGQAAAGH